MRGITRGVPIFLFITFGGTWGVWGIAWLLGVFNPAPVGQIVVALGAFAPAIAAIIVRRFVTREGFADAGLRLQLRNGWPYYLFAWLIPLPVVAAIGALSGALGIVGADVLFHRTTTAPAALPLAALGGALISAPLFWGEEFGWRSYLQLRLSSRPLNAAILTGLIWGVFHYPVILVGFEGYENVLLGLAVFPVSTVLLSIIFAWLRLKSGSVWVTCVAHAATNGVGGGLTAYLFLGGGHFLLTSYLGVLGWVPLGILCAWIVLTGRLAPGPDARFAAAAVATNTATSAPPEHAALRA
jgi:membrane protease YdiL (CAAX protease family)